MDLAILMDFVEFYIRMGLYMKDLLKKERDTGLEDILVLLNHLIMDMVSLKKKVYVMLSLEYLLMINIMVHSNT